MISFIIVDVYTDVIGRNTEIAVVASENVKSPRNYITNIRIIDDMIDFRTYCFMWRALHLLLL